MKKLRDQIKDSEKGVKEAVARCWEQLTAMKATSSNAMLHATTIKVVNNSTLQMHKEHDRRVATMETKIGNTREKIKKHQVIWKMRQQEENVRHAARLETTEDNSKEMIADAETTEENKTTGVSNNNT